jgi:hypothetical protein
MLLPIPSNSPMKFSPIFSAFKNFTGFYLAELTCCYEYKYELYISKSLFLIAQPSLLYTEIVFVRILYSCNLVCLSNYYSVMKVGHEK